MTQRPPQSARRMKVIYKITWPNGKIYVGKDLTGTVSYFGSADPRRIQADFTPEECRDLTVRKEILWESETATDREVSAKEVEFIVALRSNDPAVGYNRWPRYREEPARDPADRAGRLLDRAPLLWRPGRRCRGRPPLD